MELNEEVTWRESFFKDSFNVDQCLSRYTLKSDLETLRNDLKNYGNDLHQQMAEILKTETEAIVNLAEYLTNLNSKIDDLSLPLSQLREEIKSLYDLIRTAETSCLTILQTIQHNSNKQNNLNLKFAVLSSAMYIDNMINKSENNMSCDSVILERAVNKYSFEYNYLEASSTESSVNEIGHIGNQLLELVNNMFLAAVKKNEVEVIIRCLRMYDSLGKQSEAEKTYQIHIVRPTIEALFTESHLEASNQNIDEIYKEALNFMDSNMGVLLTVLAKNHELKSYNFILNSFWIEVDKQSREGLPYLAAPGNPELFQKRFKSTWNFLSKIAKKCGSPHLIQSNQSFQEHIKRFNLPVYFEIRFQQIAGQFETVAIITPGPHVYHLEHNEISCKLKITLALWQSILRCFDAEVFIDNLADQFLKLSMLLLARYLKWFESALQEADSFTEGSSAWEDFIINSLGDLTIVKSLIANGSKGQIVYQIMPINVQPVLVKVFKLNNETICKVGRKLQEQLINVKCTGSFAHLQNVASIPRLYRRTNRIAPKEPSNYVIEAVAPILKFYKKFQPKENELEDVLEAVILSITKQYLSLVQEVLRSVCKTEESLRRLKNRNPNSNEEASGLPTSTDTMSDEMKIREQIKLDVCYFVDKLYVVAQDNSRTSMDELKMQTG